MVHNSNIKILFVSLLAISILGIGVSVLAMDHSARGHEVCGAAVTQGADCSVPAGQDMCIEYHLGLFNKLSQATPAEFKLAVFSLLFLPLLIWLIAKPPLLGRFLNIKTRMRWLWEDLVYSFSKQFWFLTLQEKRGP